MGSKTWACRIIKLKRIVEKTKTDMNLNIFFSLGIKKEKIIPMINQSKEITIIKFFA